MASRTRRTAKIFAAVTGAYLVYSLTVVPLIEPAGKRREPLLVSLVETTPSAMVPLREANLDTLFAPGDWELNNPMVLKTDRGMLLVQDYHTREDGGLELFPCTLILCDTSPSGADSGARAQRHVLLRSPQGALLRFDRPLDLNRGQFGRLVSGWLMGPVTIQSPESRPGANDALDLRTDSIQITRERIVAPHDVIFRFGENTGRGRDLIVTFEPPPISRESSRGAQGARFGQFRSLELVHVESLKLRLPATERENANATSNAQASETQALKKKVPLPRDAEITCRGPFRLDFQRMTAILQDQVEMVHVNPNGPNDRLTGDELSIHFCRSEAARQTARGESASDLSTLPQFEVERVVLQGAPAVLDMPSQALSARARRMEYHLPTRQIRIADDDQALLRYEGNEFQAREVQYFPAEDGTLGRLLAEGPGRLKGSLRDEPDKTFEASWGDRLIIQPHDGDHAISLLAGARVRYQGVGEFAAEDLHLWLQQAPPTSDSADAQRFAYRPVRMLAERDVQLDSPQLAAATQRVEVWFRYDDTTRDAEAVPSDASQRFQRDAESIPTGQKFEVAGQHLQVQLLQRGSETQVEHLILEGNIRLREIQTAKPGETPLNVVGDLVQLEHANNPHTRMLVQGSPAEVAARNVAVVGERIQLNRERNRMWIAGPGSMVLPIAATALQGRQDLHQPALPGNMTVQWQTRMQFDGQTAQFKGDVRLRGRQPTKEGEVFDLLVVGANLEVALTRRIDFSDDKPPTDVDVGRIAFRGDVTLQNTSHRGGMQTSIDRMHVRDLTIDQPSGRLHAAGPGWGASVRPGERMPAISSTTSANAGDATQTPSLAYVRVDFEDQISGNIHDRVVEFHGRVRTLYGPVTDWREKLDPDPPGGLDDGVYLLTSDRLALADMQTAGEDEAAIEVVADGNATVEGSHFTARAWRVSYARAKELLILQGDGRNDAQLWLKGSVTPDAAAQQIRFWTHNNSIQVDGGRFFHLNQAALSGRQRDRQRATLR